MFYPPHSARIKDNNRITFDEKRYYSSGSII